MTISHSLPIPEFSLLVLIGAPGSGKSTFARNHFHPSEVLDLDVFLEMVGDENVAARTEDAIDSLAYILEKRLKNKLLTVVDAPNVSQKERKAFRQLSRKYHCPLVAAAFALPADLCLARARAAAPGLDAVQLRGLAMRVPQEAGFLKSEGFDSVTVFQSDAEAEAVQVQRRPLPSNMKGEKGPFDILGDVHGCLAELKALLAQFGYVEQQGKWSHPEGRRLVFVGDLVHKGPDTVGVLRLSMALAEQEMAFFVLGNHDARLARKLAGEEVEMIAGMAGALEELEKEPGAFRAQVQAFLEGLPHHLELDGGKLVVAHAGLRADMVGRTGPQVEAFSLYAHTLGEVDELGWPVSFDWAEEHKEPAILVHGHVPVPKAAWQGQTLNLDTGCVYGGFLSALRYPERKIAAIAAEETYAAPKRPLNWTEGGETEEKDRSNLLPYAAFAGRNLAGTRYKYFVTLKEELAMPAMEAISRSRIDPRWMIYLPTFFSPTKSSKSPAFLEHPQDAFSYYRKKGMEKALIHDEGLGRRAVVVLCRDGEVAKRRFGVSAASLGAVYGPLGQAIFDEREEERDFLERLHGAVTEAGFWQDLETDWLALEGEMAPWGRGRGAGMVDFLAGVGESGLGSLEAAVAALSKAADRGVDLGALSGQTQVRLERLADYKATGAVSLAGETHFYAWHLLGSEGRTYETRSQAWHLDMLGKLSRPGFCSLPAYRWIDLENEMEMREGAKFWMERTAETRASMLLKPEHLLVEGGADLVQPGILVRGKTALRRIFGPEYDDPRYLEEFKRRSLKDKRMQVVRQFALGWECLHSFVEGQEHEQIFPRFFTGLSLNAVELDARL